MRFLEKPYSGIVGEIKYIYRSWVFVYCRTHVENAGMLVSKSRQLAQVGGTATKKVGESQPPSRPPTVQPVTGGRSANRRGGHGQFDRSIIGKTARIVAVCLLYTSNNF